MQDRREKIQEQVMTARENRSVVFNPTLFPNFSAVSKTVIVMIIPDRIW
jgi:hypothetical protein